MNSVRSNIKPPLKRRTDETNLNPHSCHPSSHSNSLCKIFESKSKENQILFEKQRTREFSTNSNFVKKSSRRISKGKRFQRKISRQRNSGNSMMKMIKCLQSNILAKFKPDGIIGELRYITQKPYGSSYNVENDYNYSDESDSNINSIDDCVDGIEEPLYGFRVKVNLIENQSCILGQTCKGSPVNDDQGNKKMLFFYKNCIFKERT